jgi:hypothetical protein
MRSSLTRVAATAAPRVPLGIDTEMICGRPRSPSRRIALPEAVARRGMPRRRSRKPTRVSPDAIFAVLRAVIS